MKTGCSVRRFGNFPPTRMKMLIQHSITPIPEPVISLDTEQFSRNHSIPENPQSACWLWWYNGKLNLEYQGLSSVFVYQSKAWYTSLPGMIHISQNTAVNEVTSVLLPHWDKYSHLLSKQKILLLSLPVTCLTFAELHWSNCQRSNKDGVSIKHHPGCYQLWRQNCSTFVGFGQQKGSSPVKLYAVPCINNMGYVWKAGRINLPISPPLSPLISQ